MSEAYLAGLRLAGRRVVLVGGGSSVNRRIHRLLDAGALVTVVAPQVTPALEALAAAGRINWQRREYALGDLAGSWYAMASSVSIQLMRCVQSRTDSNNTPASVVTNANAIST